MYVNYGDKNFFEYGCLVDLEGGDTWFDIIYCRPFDDEEDQYLFAECFVDINDSWLNHKAVRDFIGMKPNECDPIRFAIGCIEYYGVDNFRDYNMPAQLSRQEICEILKHKFIASDNLDIEW